MKDVASKLPSSSGKAGAEIGVQSNTAVPAIVVMQQVMIVKDFCTGQAKLHTVHGRIR